MMVEGVILMIWNNNKINLKQGYQLIENMFYIIWSRK